MIKEQSLNLDDFIKNSRDSIENKIVTSISDKQIVTILQGGKRLRAILSHLAFKTCTSGKETDQQYQSALENAVLIELAHTASLVHDDIIDRDKERRGRPAFYVKVGIANALLTGHKMLTAGFKIGLNHRRELTKVFMDAYEEVVHGEIKEVDFNKNGFNNTSNEISVKSKYLSEYNKIINMKTASLFSHACKAGAVEANMSKDIVKVFADYGREIGLAYQLADDLVDLVKGELIDSVIIPLVNRLENKPITRSMSKRRIRKKLEKYSSKIQRLYIEEIKTHINNAIDLSKSKDIPSSQYKNLLNDAPTFIINQMLREINIPI
jgi:geranylgeranyl pyrophosphate synthase